MSELPVITEQKSYLQPRAPGDPVRVVLGTMNFGKRTPEVEALRIMAAALKAGVVLFDTANAYNDGESERILGRALKPGPREDVLIATKVGFNRVNGKPEGLSRKAINAAIQGSLERLQTDWIDLYYLHTPDHETPIEESVDAIHELLRKGSVKAWGISNFASWQILEINFLCDKRQMPRPSVSQVLYNLLIRELEIEYFKFTARFPIHTTVYNPLAGGLLSGKHRYEAPDRAASALASQRGGRFENKLYVGRYWSKAMFEFVERLKPIAESEGMPLVDFAYAWIAQKKGVDSILLGPATVEHFTSVVAACARPVSPAGMDAAAALYRDHVGTDAHYVR